MEKIKSLKVKFRERKGSILLSETLDGKPIHLVCSEIQHTELEYLQKVLSHNSILNLLYVESLESELFHKAEFIIFEPDYLLDISSLAECFRPYGHHPLNYSLARLSPSGNTRHILLGNTANFFIDELVNEKGGIFADYDEILRKLFKIAPVEFTVCEDLKNQDMELAFFDSCRLHFNNIKRIVHVGFSSENIDKEKIILEPSFICHTLGLQGRLDLLMQDFSALIELKSGKGVEDFRTQTYMNSAINHYTQMILYLAVLEFNLNLQPDQVSSYLLYSKYPVLSKEEHSRIQLQKALTLRNLIVALEYDIQKQNNSQHTHAILCKIKSGVLNTSALSGNFFENYLRPGIDRFGELIRALNELERTYFMRVYTFIAKELWLSKVGNRDYEGTARAANLWNVPVEEKIAAGDFLYDLKLSDNQAASDLHFVELSIPGYEESYQPNFRPGDAVVLYARNSETDNINNRQVFKGAIDFLDNKNIRIRLRAKQRNTSVLSESDMYALEHDYMDSTYNAMFRGLYAFAEANRERRDLLLIQRLPEFNDDYFCASAEKNDVRRIVRKAMASNDCFLLIGPPGTGKTSLALKQMVENCLAEESGDILLLSYTNRAVDEICRTLVSIDESLNFIRIGSELNCSREFRSRLLDNVTKDSRRRSDVQSLISGCRIFVGTVASIWNKPDLFLLKKFDLAIVDEATQLLEPHLLGILCAKNKAGENAVNRFVLIGDHKQLPAVVLQSKEESRVEDPLLLSVGLHNLSDSLFERLYREYRKRGDGFAFDQLTQQGRMHPEIAAFPSTFFYNGKLTCAGLPHQQEQLSYLSQSGDRWMNLVADQRLVFIPSPAEEGKSDKINRSEVEIVASIARALYKLYQKCELPFNRESLGIITPYRSQMALIRKSLQNTGIKELSEVTVDTVERFQGSQKDVIIYSFCVNKPWQVKALPNLITDEGVDIDRKLNVVLTRARKQLFITGNSLLLSQNKLFGSLIDHIRENSGQIQ